MRVKSVDPENPPEGVRPAFQKIAEPFGRVLTPNLVMAQRPEIFLAAVRLGQAIGASPVVEGRLKLMVSIRAAQMIGCPL